MQSISSKKFHSVLMTSYSIDLYYWELQLLKTLSDKGICCVSAVVDSDCLSEQLPNSSKSSSEKRNFGLYGYKSRGAFHPKIQFYAGENDILVLIGSGNLTTSGHGKNLEVWFQVEADSDTSPAFPFICDVWSYLTGIYRELGKEPEKTIEFIKENCNLLKGGCTANFSEYQISEECGIKLFVNRDSFLFNQCVEWIGQEKVKSITIMSPFYDKDAKLIRALYEAFKPEAVNIIVEDDFGSPPSPKSIPEYVKIYDWKDAVPEDKSYQKFFHSKCFFFTGEEHSYMICGSANASEAAFGTPGRPPSNKEASVGLKSKKTDFLAASGLRLITKKEDIKETDCLQLKDNPDRKPVVWIKEASYECGCYTVKVKNDKDLNDARITFYADNEKESFEYQEKAGECTFCKHSKPEFNPFYVEITDGQNKLISNRQYVTLSSEMVYNKPFPDKVRYSRLFHSIETGQILKDEVMQLIEMTRFLYRDKDVFEKRI